MIKVTANNRVRLAKYIELLDNAAHIAGDYRLREAREGISSMDAISGSHGELSALKRGIAGMNEKLTDELYLSMVHPGDVIRIYPKFFDSHHEAMGTAHRCTVIRVIGISKENGGWMNHDGRDYVIECQEMRILSDREILPSGKDIGCFSKRSKSNEFRSLSSVCEDLLDGKAVKTDQDEWDALVEAARHRDEVTEKYINFIGNGDESKNNK